MRTALRILGRLACWLLVVVGGFAVAVFAAVLVSAENSDQRLGSVVLMIPALLAVAGGVWGLRRTPRLWGATAETSSQALADARGRLRAGAPIVLRPSRRRLSLPLVVSLLLTAGSVWMFVDAPSVIAVVGILLFGTATLVEILQLFPGRSYVRIAADGLVVRSPLKTARWDWNDVEHFTAYEIQHQYGSTKQVGFDRRDVTPERQGFLTTVARGMSGARSWQRRELRILVLSRLKAAFEQRVKVVQEALRQSGSVQIR